MTLPAGFAALEPFVATWAAVDAPARDALRTGQSGEARQAFYDAIAPLVSAALDRLDQTPLAQHDDGEQTLMRLLLAHAHNANAVEVQGPDEVKHAVNRQRLPISRAPSDL